MSARGSYLKPMLASPGGDAFDDAEWCFEMKWDGYRVIADCDGAKVKLLSRNGLSLNNKFAPIVSALTELPFNSIIDGEVVALDAKGKPSFQLLQRFEAIPKGKLAYMVFDLLQLDGQDTRELPLLERKALLKKLLAQLKHPAIRFSAHTLKNGIAYFTAAKKQQAEGIMAKKTDSEYSSGLRSNQWLKIKHRSSMEAVIVGYTAPNNSRTHFGSLILAEYKGDELNYLGHTGTGFTQKILADLWKKMQRLKTTSSPFDEKIKTNRPVTWLKPQLVAEVEYAEITSDGILRQSAFKGLRTDKKLMDMKSTKKDEQANSKDSVTKVGGKTLTLTNLSKLYWPKDKFSKGDLIAYYDSMADYILPYLKDRPLSLKRNPNGILDEGFYHKDAGEQAPSWVKTYDVYSDSSNKIVNYIVCNDKATLLYVANLGCIEMNPWNSTRKKPDNPTYMIIDIDPADKNTFDQVIETALVTKDVLDEAGVDAYCKTSGATGLHIYVPMGNKYDYDQVRMFGQLVASMVVDRLPKFTSIERSLKKRGNNIYVDFLQNSRGQTLASAYSVRPKPGATVSTPLEWKEVKKGLHPSDFTILNILKRVEKKGDLFKGALAKGVDLKKVLEKLQGSKDHP
jgi:bifunctional non-homologous end joining protein LigD